MRTDQMELFLRISLFAAKNNRFRKAFLHRNRFREAVLAAFD